MSKLAPPASALVSQWSERQATPTPSTLAPDFRSLVSRLGADVAASLTRALTHLGELADCKRPDGRILQAIGDEIADARKIGIVGQQIARLASGLVQPDSEQVLACEMAQSIVDRRRASAADLAAIHTTIDRAPSQSDPSLLSMLIEAALDWGFAHTAADMTFQVIGSHHGQSVTLTLSFDLAAQAGRDTLDTMHWHLVFFAAQTLGARVQRRVNGLNVILSVTLPSTEPRSALSAAAADRPAAGCQVLVVAPERDLRNKVRLAIRGLDVLVDYVSSVDAAVRYCEDGVPEAVVYDGAIGHGPADDLRLSLGTSMRDLPFIEITGLAAALPAPAPRRAESCVALARLQADLPSALATQLARAV